MHMHDVNILKSFEVLDLFRFPHCVDQPPCLAGRCRETRQSDPVNYPAKIRLRVKSVSEFLKTSSVRRYAFATRFIEEECRGAHVIKSVSPHEVVAQSSFSHGEGPTQQHKKTRFANHENLYPGLNV
ncbi:hypothetical protein C6T60_15875 [Burkholderia multivorans]|nr:hypothetical protein C6T60_15875 [Burkholderia multivorans]